MRRNNILTGIKPQFCAFAPSNRVQINIYRYCNALIDKLINEIIYQSKKTHISSEKN